MFNAVLFDLDNTLIDRDSAARRFCDQFLRRVRPDLKGAKRRQVLQRIDALDDHGYAPRDWWCRQVCEAIGEDRISPNKMEPAELWHLFRTEFAGLIAPPGISAELEQLSANAQIALISNGSSAMQRAKLVAAELAPSLFSQVIISQELGLWKPDRRIFVHALNAMGALAERTLMIGDDPMRDIEPARELGMATCWIAMGRRYRSDLRPPTWKVETIHDFFSRYRTGEIRQRVEF